MKEFGDGFYKNNGEANNSEKKEPQKEGVETVKDWKVPQTLDTFSMCY